MGKHGKGTKGNTTVTTNDTNVSVTTSAANAIVATLLTLRGLVGHARIVFTLPGVVGSMTIDATLLTAIMAAPLTLTYRRTHDRGIAMCSYGASPLRGIVFMPVAWLGADTAVAGHTFTLTAGPVLDGATVPSTLTANVSMCQPVARKVDGTTSAVVSKANQSTGKPLATPAAVAETAAEVMPDALKA